MSLLSKVLADSLETPHPPATPTDCGVVTTGAGMYFPGVQLLYESVVRTHADLRVAYFEVPGHPLSREQAQWAARQPRLDVLQLRPDWMVAPDYWRPWWQKPAIVRASPFRRTLWMDCDCLVLRSLVPLFNHLEANPPFLPPNAFLCANAPQLKRYFDLGTQTEAFNLTTAVTGFSNGRDLHRSVLDWWCGLTETISGHPDLLERFVTYYDEGVMRLVLQKLNLTNIVWPDMHWCWHAYHGQPGRWGKIEEDLDALLEKWPDERVLHMTGRPKAWEFLHTDLLDLDPHS
jgi:hypothetical protein